MIRNFPWERCLRPVLAAAVFVLLILSLLTPALTSEHASPPDQAELHRMLNEACAECHNLNRVILQTGEWKLKDWMHAFDKMAKISGLTNAEKLSIAHYMNAHRREIELERTDGQDRPETMSIGTYYVLFENRCVVCHDAEMIGRTPKNLDREDLKHIVDRMVEKAPHFLDGVNTDNIVNYLGRSKVDAQEIVE